MVLSDIPSIPSIPSVINNLTSTSTTDALSANQGKILKGLADSHTHSASDITSGTLPLTRGGTGVTSLTSLKSLLGLSSSNYQILYGTASVYTGSESSYATFSPPFKSTPVVVATAYAYYTNVSVWITSVDQNSVDFESQNATRIHWIAIGEPS